MAMIDIFKSKKGKWKVKARRELKPYEYVIWSIYWGDSDSNADEVLWYFPGETESLLNERTLYKDKPTDLIRLKIQKDPECSDEDAEYCDYEYHVLIDGKLAKETSPPKLRVRKSTTVTPDFSVDILLPTYPYTFELQHDEDGDYIMLDLKGEIRVLPNGELIEADNKYKWLFDEQDLYTGKARKDPIRVNTEEDDHTIKLYYADDPNLFDEIEIEVYD